jgi:probable rRNA maturation factor
MNYVVHQHADPEFADFLPKLVDVAQATYAEVDAVSGEMTLALVNTEKIRALNFEFRNLDEPTDVLSFADDSIDPDTGIRYYGDVVIAVPIAIEQAEKAGHPLQAELSLLAIHGVLHLLGYDHQEKSDKASMWEIQSAVLDKCGFHISQPS